MRHAAHPYERVMSHIWLSHVTHMNASYHTQKLILSRIWMRHVSPVQKKTSCHTCKRVTYMTMWGMSHTYERVLSRTSIHRVTNMHATCHVRHVPCARTPNQSIFLKTHTSESCHARTWVLRYMRVSHVTHMNESCHPYERDVSHAWKRCVTHMNEACYITHTRTHTHIRTHARHTHRFRSRWHLCTDTTQIRVGVCDITHLCVCVCDITHLYTYIYTYIYM